MECLRVFLLFLLNLGIIASAVKGSSYQVGKINASSTRQGWNCNSGCEAPGHCTLPRCTSVTFPKVFSGSGTVRVFVSLSYQDNSSVVHSPSALWAESVNTVGFKLCSRTTGASNDTGIINWLAFQDKPMLRHGSVTFSGIWTTETKCDKVTFSQSFPAKPSVFVSVRYARSTKPNDAMYAWLENVHTGGFEACLREFLSFDGKHQDAIVDWFAFLGNDSQVNFTITGEEFFPNNEQPSAENNFGFCQVVPFNTTFYQTPAVLVSVTHQYNRKVKGTILPENNILSVWVEDVGLESMKICVKDLTGSGPYHDSMTVSYGVTGDLNPCLNVHCPRFGVCKTYSAHDARCECDDQCPSYQDPVCTANGTTYDNKCWHELSYCRGLENNLVYHPGSCEGFPIVRGRLNLLHVPKWHDSSCQTVAFPPYRFYPDKKVHVQITVNHINLNDSITVHDAVTSWTESISTKNFTVCAMQSGRKEENFNPFASIDWLAYQGAPPEGLTGTIRMQKWWSGTNCADATFPKDKFAEAPVVLVTSEHLRTGQEYDSALIWTEDVTKSSFKVCLREMQNFDGRHEDINVNWFAFFKLHKPLFSEHGTIEFPNTNPPLDEMNNAYCEFVLFKTSYNSSPTVLVSANHSTTVSGNSAAIHNGISTWIENMNASGFRVCVKELYEARYDPLSVNFAVLTDTCDPGWRYFNGYCYFISERCTNWTRALAECRKESSILVDVNSNEENVYIQHLHNGAKSWLGLNDISREGSFSWVDRGAGNFTTWATNQPNNFGDEDCVHSLGVEHKYKWNDVKCSDCHPYTCKKDINECETEKHHCDSSAFCNNTKGSYICACKPGYIGNGINCTDINECATGKHHCDSNAFCNNTKGSYICTCKPGYTGNGITCTDINECATGKNHCDSNAFCNNTKGSYICVCKPGYIGNGITCTDINECAKGKHHCDSNAFCNNTKGSYICACKPGYIGNGITCTVPTDCDCWRTRSSPSNGWSYSNDPSGSNRVDAIDFQTDDDVVLSGYRLWGVRRGSTSFHVTIRFYRARSLIAEKTGTYATSSNVKTFEVHFSQAIILKAGVTYTATARIATSAKSYHMESGLSSTTCSGVTVAFKRSSKDTNSSNVSRGQIPALILRSAKCYK